MSTRFWRCGIKFCGTGWEIRHFPSSSLVRRTNEMTLANLTQLWQGEEAFAPPREQRIVRVISWAARRVQVNPTKRSEIRTVVSTLICSNYARMEVLNQPLAGWPVDLRTQWCPVSSASPSGPVGTSYMLSDLPPAWTHLEESC
ncbi:unnamed protein product [Phytophthora fragariaefolia]|uniref:Unnamed protein product n=1 Tax=Phytophthora fragariaefolia TaxID=1490495 RepID=A0A9W6XQS4_9STRA|nr:unnamed protein product [Phytophthora fragariaefolia]